MTNKVICAEKLREFLKKQNERAMEVWKGEENVNSPLTYMAALTAVLEEINSDSLTPSPAQAEGVISTVTNCPTCGSAVKVGGDGETHYYIPITHTTNTR